jgi:hypothetical protein
MGDGVRALRFVGRRGEFEGRRRVAWRQGLAGQSEQYGDEHRSSASAGTANKRCYGNVSHVANVFISRFCQSKRQDVDTIPQVGDRGFLKNAVLAQ